MHYVKQFSINGVATKQVACIELNGVPNAATEGAVGVLGIDMLSPTHEVYRCVAVNGSVYTWELLSAGMSIISAVVTGEGGEFKTFSYSDLRIPNNYLIKIGDLILDSKGYLYQINTIGNESCVASYCGTHIGGIASGDKDYSLVVKNGKLQLVTESGNVISNIEYSKVDNNTLYRNSNTGEMTVKGIRTIDGSSLRIFVGTEEEYQTLTEEQKRNLFALITDDTSKEMLENGDIVVGKASILEKNAIEFEFISGSGSIDFDVMDDMPGLWAISADNSTFMLFVDNVNNTNTSTTDVWGRYISYRDGDLSFRRDDGTPADDCTASMVKIYRRGG